MFWTLVAIAVALIALVIWIYNTLVQRRNRYRNAFAQIDVQFRRRHDLIPNLVEVAQAYLKHERETLEAVTAARGAAIAGLQAAARNPGDATAVSAFGTAKQGLSGALGRLLAVSETYPNLKANSILMQLAEKPGPRTRSHSPARHSTTL